MFNGLKKKLMVFIRNLVLLSIVLLASVLVLQLSSCDNNSKTKKDNLDRHMSDSTIGHVAVLAKRSKKLFENELIRNENMPVFAAKQYIVDIGQSELEWFCGKHTGFVKLKNGEFTIEKKQFSKGNFTINMDSIFNTDIENNLMRGTLDNILKSDELFDVEKFPETELIIAEVVHKGGNEFSLSGSLKIKERTNLIKINAFIDVHGDTLFAKSEHFYIDRTEWGVTNMSRKFAKSKDEFIVTDSVSFIVRIKAFAKHD